MLAFSASTPLAAKALRHRRTVSSRTPNASAISGLVQSANGTVSKNRKVRKTAVPDDVAASLRYAVSQRLRKRIEESFGWSKTVGGLAQVKVRGLAKVRGIFVFGVAAYNLVRLPKLLAPNGEVCPAA